MSFEWTKSFIRPSIMALWLMVGVWQTTGRRYGHLFLVILWIVSFVFVVNFKHSVSELSNFSWAPFLSDVASVTHSGYLSSRPCVTSLEGLADMSFPNWFQRKVCTKCFWSFHTESLVSLPSAHKMSTSQMTNIFRFDHPNNPPGKTHWTNFSPSPQSSMLDLNSYLM